MTKKETELQNRILTVLEGNTKALENLYDLMIKLFSTKPAFEIKESYAESIPPGETKHETSVKTEITVEYCRKALKAVRTKLSNDETRAFLFQFGEAKTIPDLDKKYYEDFIAKATAIMQEK